ncbi:PREDICTED: uncharacterized protein LOC108562189, partial [Nicrophorus vespilloides]|uniref:Uncharacterized protein LOC108562189 n=1 Tax=Nicrophorus vespilloides TaxID=110193 RepID=A0ABM1MMY4_NICVS
MTWMSAAILALLLMSIVDCQKSLVEADASAGGTSMESSRTLECHRRLYSYKVTQTDENGKMCWDIIQVWACWGRCDSNE